MNYSNTARVLSLLFHSLIFMLFGALGMYFGFFVVPQYFNVAVRSLFTANLFEGAFNLYLELAVLGLAMMSVSAYGLFHAIKAFLSPSEDAPVIKSFVAFIAEGYILSVFFLLQGVLFFDLTANNNIAFVIIMSILITVLLLIATNIPMVRLFDGKDNTPLLSGLSLSAATVFGWGAVEGALALLGSLAAEVYDGQRWVNTQLMIGTACAVIIAGLTIAAGLIIRKKGVSDKKGSALSGFLNSGAVLTVGGALIAIGVIEVVLNSTKGVHLESIPKGTYVAGDASYGLGYGIMALVLGSLSVVASIYFFVVTAKESSKKTVSKA
jgi:hypothetical protein